MAETLCILVHRPPYGEIQAAEAVRHLNGATAHGLEATAILLGDGVYLARSGQDPRATGWTALSLALEDALGDGQSGSPHLWGNGASLRARGLPAAAMVSGAVVVDERAIAEAVAQARWVMVY